MRTRTVGLLAKLIAAGLLAGCGIGVHTPAGSASYQSAPCPVPNFPGVPEADLGPNYSCGYLTVGVSYGTDLALQLLRDHPEGIRSVVLDSVVPPSQNIVDKWWEAPASGLKAIFEACAAQSACAAAYPDLATVFTTTVNRLSTTPAEISVKNTSGHPVRVTVDGFKLIPVVLEWSASPTKVVAIPRMIYNLAKGDGALAAAAVAASDVPPDQRGLLGAGLGLGAYCQEMANWTNPDRALLQARIAMPALPDSVLRITPTGSWIFDECRAWGLGKSDPASLAPTVSTVPTLILAGTFDSSTAPSWLDRVTPGLSNSLVLRFPGVGHGVLPTSRCGQTIMTAYIANPSSSVDRSCIDGTTIAAFTTP